MIPISHGKNEKMVITRTPTGLYQNKREEFLGTLEEARTFAYIHGYGKGIIEIYKDATGYHYKEDADR